MKDKFVIENKIITLKKLNDIFNTLNEKYSYYMNIYNLEKDKNKSLNDKDKTWTYKDDGSYLKFNIVVDGKEYSFIKFDEFIKYFNDNTKLISVINCELYLSYNYGNTEYPKNYHCQNINININEEEFIMNYEITTDDDKINDTIEFIKNILINSKDKIDKAITKRTYYTIKIGLVIGYVPAMIITLLLAISSDMRMFYKNSYIGYPIITTLVSIAIGAIITTNEIEKFYKNIGPSLEDKENYLRKNEILIGKNINNVNKRKSIFKIYRKYQKFIPFELIMLFGLSITVIFL